MISPKQVIEQRMALRDEMAARVAKALTSFGLTVKETGSTNILVVENTAGTQYTVVVSHRRKQET